MNSFRTWLWRLRERAGAILRSSWWILILMLALFIYVLTVNSVSG